jgi:hypothetical protein
MSSRKLRRRLARLCFGASLVIHVTASVAADHEVANPAGGGASLVLEPVSVFARPKRGRLVYACHEPRLVVFSDRPCGHGTVVRSVSFAPEPPSGAAPTTVAAPPVAATRPKVETAYTPPEEAGADEGRQCDTLRTQLDRVDARMRQGYSARESAGLWSRWREIKDRMHVERCRS